MLTGKPVPQEGLKIIPFHNPSETSSFLNNPDGIWSKMALNTRSDGSINLRTLVHEITHYFNSDCGFRLCEIPTMLADRTLVSSDGFAMRGIEEFKANPSFSPQNYELFSIIVAESPTGNLVTDTARFEKYLKAILSENNKYVGYDYVYSNLIGRVLFDRAEGASVAERISKVNAMVTEAARAEKNVGIISKKLGFSSFKELSSAVLTQFEKDYSSPLFQQIAEAEKQKRMYAAIKKFINTGEFFETAPTAELAGQLGKLTAAMQSVTNQLTTQLTKERVLWKPTVKYGGMIITIGGKIISGVAGASQIAYEITVFDENSQKQVGEFTLQRAPDQMMELLHFPPAQVRAVRTAAEYSPFRELSALQQKIQDQGEGDFNAEKNALTKEIAYLNNCLKNKGTGVVCKMRNDMATRAITAVIGGLFGSSQKPLPPEEFVSMSNPGAEDTIQDRLAILQDRLDNVIRQAEKNYEAHRMIQKNKQKKSSKPASVWSQPDITHIGGY